MLEKANDDITIPNIPTDGLFITFEGGEGSGKSIQTKLFSEWLRSWHLDVYLTREPGGCKISDSIRGILLDPNNSRLNFKTEFLLFLASRAQHIQDIISPALKDNQIVICDRYYDSSWVYQHKTRGIVNVNYFRIMNNWAITDDKGKRFVPDITFVLDIDAEIGIKRALARNTSGINTNESRLDNEQMIFHQTVNKAYRELKEEYPERVILIDANQSIKQVTRSIIMEFCKYFEGY